MVVTGSAASIEHPWRATPIFEVAVETWSSPTGSQRHVTEAGWVGIVAMWID